MDSLQNSKVRATSPLRQAVAHQIATWYPRLKGWLWTLPIIWAGLLPLTWFRGSLIAGLDLPWHLARPGYLLLTALSMWNPLGALGDPGLNFRFLPYALINWVLYVLGLSPIAIEQFFFVLWFMGAGLSAYSMVRCILPESRGAALIGGLFYMFNPYTMAVRWYELNFWNFFYAFAPLAMALWIKGLSTLRFRYLVALQGTLLLMAPSFSNLAAPLMLALVLGSYIPVHLLKVVRSHVSLAATFRYVAAAVLLSAATNLWWIVPSVFTLPFEIPVRTFSDDRLTFTSQRTTLAMVLRLKGYWGFDLTYGGTQDPMFPYASWYSSNRIFGAIGWLIPLLGLAGAVRWRRNSAVVWATAFTCISLFFMKGLQPPLQEVTRWLYDNVFIMAAFRHPFDKFGMLTLLGLAPLVGAGTVAPSQFFRLPRLGEALIGTTVTLLLVVVLAWPFWTGEVIHEGGKVVPSVRTSPPAGYEVAREWLAREDDPSRLMPLPLNKISWTSLRWLWGFDPAPFLLEKPVAAVSDKPGGDLLEQAATALLKGRSDDLGKALALMNVRYVFVRDDANWEFIAKNGAEGQRHVSASREAVFKSVKSQPWLLQSLTAAPLYFYDNRDWWPNAVYAADLPIPVAEPGSLGTWRLPKGNELKRAVIISFVDASQMALSPSRIPPQVTFSYDLARPWIVTGEVEAEGPFVLILSQYFDKYWDLYEAQPSFLQLLFRTGRANARHFVANGYANAWYFPEGGIYRFTMFYWPQAVLWCGIGASLAVWILLTVKTLWEAVRRAKLVG